MEILNKESEDLLAINKIKFAGLLGTKVKFKYEHKVLRSIGSERQLVSDSYICLIYQHTG